MVQLRMLGIADDVDVQTAQWLSTVAVLCCLHVIMLLADDPRRPLQASVEQLVTALCSSMTLPLVLRCTQRRGCCQRRGLGAATVVVAATRHSARMYSGKSQQQLDMGQLHLAVDDVRLDVNLEPTRREHARASIATDTVRGG
jgi:hypothetical protein